MKMKRPAVLILILMVSIALAACGGGNGSDSPPVNSASPGNSGAVTTPEAGGSKVLRVGVNGDIETVDPHVGNMPRSTEAIANLYDQLFTYTGNLMEDERVWNAFCVSGGANAMSFGGQNTAKSHWDGMCSDITMVIDGMPICEDGHFVHPDLITFEG